MVLSGNQNSEHFSGKLVSFWGGGLRPQTAHRGSAPGPRWGTSVPQTPSDLLPPGQIPSYATVQECLIFYDNEL